VFFHRLFFGGSRFEIGASELACTSKLEVISEKFNVDRICSSVLRFTRQIIIIIIIIIIIVKNLIIQERLKEQRALVGNSSVNLLYIFIF